ncbi:MAG: amino acid adenylation domain-containing protein [Cyanobacteria bacterium P01_H01_bin.15]
MTSINDRLSKLSPAQRQLLTQKLRQKQSQIAPRPAEQSASLSLAQQRLWLLNRLEPDSAAYNFPCFLSFQGDLKIDILERALNEIIRRHEVLRSCFPEVEGQPTVEIATELILTLQRMDLSQLAEAEQQQRFQQLAHQEAQAPFDITQGPLIRAKLLYRGPQNHILLLTLHHIVFDAWSRGIFNRELQALYTAFAENNPSPLADLPIQYADFAYWQQQWLTNQRVQTQLGYWRQKLANIPAVLELPNDRAQTATKSDREKHLFWTLEAEETKRLQSFSKEQGCTVFMTLLAAFKILLARLSGQTDIFVGIPVAGRTRLEVEPLLGFFVNTLVLRSDLASTQTFTQLLAQVRETTLTAQENQDVPFEKVIEELNPERILNRKPLCQIWFNMVSLAEERPSIKDLEVKSLPFRPPNSKFDLGVYIRQPQTNYQIDFAYSANLFSKERIEILLGQYKQLLMQVIEQPETAIANYSLATPGLIAQSILPDPKLALVEEPFEPVTKLLTTWADRHPDSVAISQGEQKWSYRELREKSYQCAQTLIVNGMKPGDTVAVSGDRSFGLIVAMWGILFSGGVLLTLDPTLPQKRKERMLALSEAKYILYVGNLLPEDNWLEKQSELLHLSALTGDIKDDKLLTDTDASLSLPELQRSAYIFFTSGTTGTPKGILGTHQGLAHFLYWQRHTFSVQPGDRVAQLTGLSFDVVLREIFLPLSSGARLCLPPASADLSPVSILPWLDQQQISILHIVPSLAQVWINDLPEQNSLSNLRCLFFAGEPLFDKLVLQWRHCLSNSCRIINLYGPTETTLAKCYFEIPKTPPTGVQPVGTSLPGSQALVLADHQRLCGVGEPGEIVIRTPYRTAGYLKNPEENTRRFVPNSAREDENDLLYFTGDSGRYRPDGQLEILGRLDNQIKIRGVRVELGEISSLLEAIEEIKNQFVMVREDTPDDKKIVAYVVPAPGKTIETYKLRERLRLHLPQYMMPSAFVMLPVLPLTPNGKVDHQALPAPEPVIDISEFITPETPTEKTLSRIWEEVLNTEQVSATADFFELGGHSLLAVKLISRIRQQLDCEIPIRELFACLTIRNLAKYIHSRSTSSPVKKRLSQLSPKQHQLLAKKLEQRKNQISTQSRDPEAPLPLSLAQQRLWFIDELEGQSPLYNLSLILEFEGAVNPTFLEQSLRIIIQRHKILRAQITADDGIPCLAFRDESTWKFNTLDFSHIPSEDREAHVHQALKAELMSPFALNQDWLIRAALLQKDTEKSTLVIVTHHIVSDGWSTGILRTELSALYEAYVQNQEPSLPPLPIQYADYSIWQRQQFETDYLKPHTDYWRLQLTGTPPLIELPLDRPRPAILSYRGQHLRSVLSAEQASKLTKLGQQRGMTLFMVLLAAFQTLLFRYSGQPDIVVGTPIANRNRTEIESLIGFFANTLVLRSQFESAQSFEDLLFKVKETTLNAYAYQDFPFEQVVEILQPQRNLSYSPVFQVMFALQNLPPVTETLGDITWQRISVSTETAKFDLGLFVREAASGLNLTWEYNTDLFDMATIERMAQHFSVLLDGVIANPAREIACLPILTDPERSHLLVELNNTATDYPRDKCLHELFEEQARKTPNTIAIEDHNQSITYQELDQQAEQLAAYLGSKGIAVESTVGLFLDRSLSMIIAVLAILKAGAAYVPLDLNYPAARIEYMLSNSEASQVLTTRSLSGRLPASITTICIDQPLTAPIAHTQSAQASPDNLAYLIYTSGSTGKPKGVAMTHKTLVNLIQWQCDQSESQQRTLQFSPISFDVSCQEIFSTWASGGTLVLITEETRQDFGAFFDYLTHQKINRLFLPFVALQGLAEIGQNRDFPGSLQEVITAGEALKISPAIAKFFEKGSSCRLQNQYGPSETHVAIAFSLTGAPDTWATFPPIGQPIANALVYLLDGMHQIVPIGIPGEIYIGGTAIARGYHNLPEQTEAKFIDNPFGPGRLYKTGDLGRYRTDGAIDYLGRSDRQVKIRGFRIELGEVEAQLNAMPEIKTAIAVVREDQTGDKRLIAYGIPKQRETIDIRMLKAYLSDKLPDYMIPVAIVCLDKFPVTPSGKIDRKALPTQEFQTDDIAVAPRDPLERQLVDIWQRILGLQSIGIQDDFFELGGHSLLAVKLFSEIEKTCNEKLPLATLFQARNIAELATYIRERRFEEHSCLIQMQTMGERPPLFFLPPAGGHMLVYERLANNLGPDQPMYGLEFQASANDDAQGSSIKNTVSEFIRAMRQVQPNGPYHLIGLSFGGLLAWAVAEELQRQGEPLATIILLDCAAPGTTKRLTGFPRFIAVASWVIYERVRHFWRICRDDVKKRLHSKKLNLESRKPTSSSVQTKDQVQQHKLQQQVQDIVESLKSAHGGNWQKWLDYWGARLVTLTESKYLVKPIYGGQHYLDDIRDFLDDRTLEVLQTKYNLLKRYQPGPLSCPVLVFRATERIPSLKTSFTMGWEPFVQKELKVIPIHGGHHTIVTSTKLATQLARYLDIIHQNQSSK